MLAPATVTRIAARHGFSDAHPTVVADLARAMALHGRREDAFDGDRDRFWGCDADGLYDAALLLDGFLGKGFGVRGPAA